MATRNHYLSTISLVLTIFLHISLSQASSDLPFFHRSEDLPPRVCKDAVVDRAVHCGCFGYRRFYRKYPEWSAIEEFCEEASDGRITRSAVLGDCRRSQFVRSGRIGLREMNKYFKKVNDVCMTPEKLPPSGSPRPTELAPEPLPTKIPPSYEAPSFDVPPSEEPSSEEQGFNEPALEVLPSEEPSEAPVTKAPPPKVPPTKVPITKVPGPKVPPSKVTRTKALAAAKGLKTTLPPTEEVYSRFLPAETVRIRYEFIHKMLSRFCLVLVHSRRTKLTARQVYNICCPRGR